ncbi:hypothetical protein VIGAN_02000800 [Vigna angularis var. angularis]|uniref:EF-hand domain-containing protein n=1 Tax=Vigna angularis var. angularis TaxID=157739 RepID=A0A0S3R9T2_PHAAN|nr:uncharacterized protein LOC108330776 isoform X1 [Vigna angularis]BAT77429.1 hypothetical protein VIGAN_02000800 [Vigna angularis var. angularis]
MENRVTLQEWFDRVDSEKSGSITAVQLKAALAVGNLQFPLSVVHQMIRMYDFDRNGTMSFQEFVALNNFLLKVATYLLLLVLNHSTFYTSSYQFTSHHMFVRLPQLSSFVLLTHVVPYLQVQHAFSDLERGRGFLVPDDVFEALVKIGFKLDSPAFYTVCESFDQSKNGRFRLDDFISICIFLQSARNLFNSFDTAKQGRVTLDLNQFVYCTANCRI